MTTMQVDLLTELEPVVEDNLNRHLAKAKPWNPHDYVPWSRGRDFALLGGEDWTPEDSHLDEVSKAAMIVNLLTEDNLPSYHREIATRFGRDGAWGTWVHRWTAEEGRHAYCIRDYLLVTRGVDPVELERARMQHMQVGYDTAQRRFRSLSKLRPALHADRIFRGHFSSAISDSFSQSIVPRIVDAVVDCRARA